MLTRPVTCACLTHVSLPIVDPVELAVVGVVALGHDAIRTRDSQFGLEVHHFSREATRNEMSYCNDNQIALEYEPISRGGVHSVVELACTDTLPHGS
jgi:hypothetical protein